MKKAFTLIELVLVIVIVGILSTQISPNFNRDGLQEAANQIVSHIRYTQHLAMMDNKFDPRVQNWFRKRWQLLFDNPSGSIWGYSIYSESGNNAIMNANEIAKNPLGSGKMLTAFSTTVADYTKNLLISDAYDITNVTLTGTGTSIVFDTLGRPFDGNTSLYTSPTMGLQTTDRNITLRNSDGDTKIITIAAETGYAYIR